MNNIRVGFGYDVHVFAPNRELWLGGIKIEYFLGLSGHSDADVLIHALCDALLGAANLRDIGFHFPDTANEFKNIDSKILLKRTMSLIREKGMSSGMPIVRFVPKLPNSISTFRLCRNACPASCMLRPIQFQLKQPLRKKSDLLDGKRAWQLMQQR